VVRSAASALGAIGGDAKTVVPALIEALQHAHAPVRRSAAAALGRIGAGAKAALPALRHALTDPDESVRSDVAAALLKSIRRGEKGGLQ